MRFTRPRPDAWDRVQLVGRNGCHLCEVAATTASRVLTDVAGPGQLRRLDVDGELGPHTAQRAEWSELVPVVLLDDRVFAVISLDDRRLRGALTASPPR